MKYWTIFFEGMAGGLAALLMPCIFPMLPMTVSFFTKGAGKGRGVRKAIIYGLSIIGIYVALGLVVTVLFGADALALSSVPCLFKRLRPAPCWDQLSGCWVFRLPSRFPSRSLPSSPAG